MPVPKKQIKLTTLGARSAEPRKVTLYAWDDGDDLILVGSWGGAARDPAWIHNLRAHPRATVRVVLDEFEADAREVTDSAERDRLWAIVVERFPTYGTYQRRTKRRIPIFVLTRKRERG